jgi:hypothetical protein
LEQSATIGFERKKPPSPPSELCDKSAQKTNILTPRMTHNPLSSYFATEQSNTLICTSAGVIGGITKAVITPQLLNITFDGSFTVVGYAALSSIAAYFAKEVIGCLYKRVVRLMSKRGKKPAKEKGGNVDE